METCQFLTASIVLRMRGDSSELAEAWKIIDGMARGARVHFSQGQVSRTGECARDITEQRSYEGSVRNMCRFMFKLEHRVVSDHMFLLRNGAK